MSERQSDETKRQGKTRELPEDGVSGVVSAQCYRTSIIEHGAFKVTLAYRDMS